jgi:predicted SAM-dependent methyltransferase
MKMIVDLGCGKQKQGDIGIDVSPLSCADIICHLGFEPIPLENESVDKVYTSHFLEHLPQAVYYLEDGHWKCHTPVIYLFNEVYRILKPAGLFEIRVPKWDSQEMFQDPTHKSVWTHQSFQYFHEDCCGGLSKLYGITSKFITIVNEIDRLPFEIHAVLQKQ